MATVINNPAPSDSSGSNAIQFAVTALLILVIGGILLFYALPYLRNMSRVSSPTIQVPDKVDINVNQQPQSSGQ